MHGADTFQTPVLATIDYRKLWSAVEVALRLTLIAASPQVLAAVK